MIIPFSACASTDVEKARNSVVQIIDGSQSCTGCGVVVGKADAKYIVTCLQLLDDDADGKLSEHEQKHYVVAENSKLYEANVIAVSERANLAVLTAAGALSEREPIPIRFFQKEDLRSADRVYSIGPAGMSDYGMTESQMQIISGVVRCVRDAALSPHGEMIEHDARISGTGIGGPLVDEKGRLLGINIDGQGWETYAVSSNEVILLLKEANISYSSGGWFFKGWF